MSPPITERLWHGGVPGLRPGDLITPGHHRVAPAGPVQRSAEDTIATYMASSARVVAVYARAVTLTWSQRRALHREWKAADDAAAQERGSAS